MMFAMTKNMGEKYSPMYFLASLGGGGLTVSFFMYLMFMTPHKSTPVPTFESIIQVFQSGNIWQMVMTVAALAGIIFFAVLHYRTLIWNIGEYKQFKKTEAFNTLVKGNGEVQLMALPLTYAMSVNVAFILGALFVPGLWSVVEYLFPAALIAFGVIGIYALRIFGDFFGRILSSGGFDCSKNNSLSQMLAVFAFAMVGVGFSAGGAMSHTIVTSGIGIIFAILFFTIAVLLGFVSMVLGFRAMLENGVDRDAAVSLWIVIPIITVLGIGIYRIIMGLHHNFDMPTSAPGALVLFSILGSIQVMFGLLGYRVMKDTEYFNRFIHGDDKHAVSYALICPGVAGTVMAFFFLHKGLVATGIVSMFSVPYFILLVPVVYLQYKTITVLLRLNGKMLTGKPMPVLNPAT